MQTADKRLKRIIAELSNQEQNHYLKLIKRITYTEYCYNFIAYSFVHSKMDKMSQMTELSYY